MSAVSTTRSSAVPDLRTRPEVRAVLGPEGIARAAEASLTGGQCVNC